MSKITKCDICGAIDNGKKLQFNETYRVPVQVKRWGTRGVTFVDIDICYDCLKLLKEKAEEAKKND